MLPVDVDDSTCDASFDEGVLSIHIPKVEAASRRWRPSGRARSTSPDGEQAVAAAAGVVAVRRACPTPGRAGRRSDLAGPPRGRRVTSVLIGVAVVLALNLFAGLARALRGPRAADRLTAALLVGSTGTALLVVLSAATGAPALRDVALVLVVLASLVVVVFVGDDVTRGRP